MIVLMGPTGSGKGEQGDRLIRKLGWPRISTSDILRRTQDTKIRQKILRGELVSDQEMLALLEAELKKIDTPNQEFILDGAPRSVPQAEWLVKNLRSGQLKLTAIIHLNVPKQELLKRLLTRGRDDDSEAAILKKIEEYELKTAPVLDYLRRQGVKVYKVNGSGPPEQVEARIQEILEKAQNESA